MKYAELVKQVSKSTTARNMIAINVVKPFDVNMHNAPGTLCTQSPLDNFLACFRDLSKDVVFGHTS